MRRRAAVATIIPMLSSAAAFSGCAINASIDLPTASPQPAATTGTDDGTGAGRDNAATVIDLAPNLSGDLDIDAEGR